MVKNYTCNAEDAGDKGSLWAEKILDYGNGKPPSFFHWESHGQWSLHAGGPWDHKESNTTQNTCRHPYTAAVGTQSSLLSVFKAGL